MVDEPEILYTFESSPTFHSKSVSSDYSFLTEDTSLKLPSRPESWQSQSNRFIFTQQYPSPYKHNLAINMSLKSERFIPLSSKHKPISSETLVSYKTPLYPMSPNTFPKAYSLKKDSSINSVTPSSTLQDLAKLISSPAATVFPPLVDTESFVNEERNVVIHPPLSEPLFSTCKVKVWESCFHS